jgi:hypothetical protein
MMEYRMDHSPEEHNPLPHPAPSLQDLSDLLWSGIRDKRWTAQTAISWAVGQAGLIIGLLFYRLHALITEECVKRMQRGMAEAQTALEVEVCSDIVNGTDGTGSLPKGPEP